MPIPSLFLAVWIRPQAADPAILSPAPELAVAMAIWALVVILLFARRWRALPVQAKTQHPPAR